MVYLLSLSARQKQLVLRLEFRTRARRYLCDRRRLEFVDVRLVFDFCGKLKMHVHAYVLQVILKEIRLNKTKNFNKNSNLK